MNKTQKFLNNLINLPLYIVMGIGLLIIMLIKPRGSIALFQSWLK